jgi:uncharacterized membrane protein
METISASIDVDVPVHMAYRQWTQLEDFPRFVPDLREVRRLDDRHVFWRAQILGIPLEWNSEITQQITDELIAWKSTRGPRSVGYVEFDPLSAKSTRVTLQVSFDTEGVVPALADLANAAPERLYAELEHYKRYLEQGAGDHRSARGGKTP